jgi:hypothetical protein
MKKHTLEDLKNSPNTLTKFFILQGKAEIKMLDDAYEFYCKFSKHPREKKKTFTKAFLRNLNFYNSALK